MLMAVMVMPIAGHTRATPPHGQFRLWGQAKNPGPSPIVFLDDPDGDAMEEDYELDLRGMEPEDGPPMEDAEVAVPMAPTFCGAKKFTGRRPGCVF